MQSLWKKQHCRSSQLPRYITATIIQENYILSRAALLIVIVFTVARLTRKPYARANADRYRNGYRDSNQDGPKQPSPPGSLRRRDMLTGH
jgi:hypothetical protein